MGTFSNPASDSLFGRLPVELATEIFDLATLNSRPNAASCRLVCQHFHIHSSPFLIRTIVIAARLEALRKARDILLHPYFRKHVTHLLWDASFYDSQLVLARDSYERAFVRESHIRNLGDLDIRLIRDADELLEDQLRSDAMKAPNRSWRISGNSSLIDHAASALAEEGTTSAISQEPQGSLTEPEESEHWDREHPCPNFHHMERFFLRGSHSSYLDYLRRWLNQENICTKGVDPARVESKHLDIDGNLARHFFLRAIDELPLLGHVSYGDFRSLTFEGESYKELCGRLFGRTVSPSLDFFHSPYHETVLPQILADLVEYRRSWLTLSIGRHPFERSLVDAGFNDHRQCDVTREFMQMPRDLLEGLNCFIRSKLQVQTLRLPDTGSDTSVRQDIGQLTKIVGAGLVNLDLGSQLTTIVGAGLVNLDLGSRAFRHLCEIRRPGNVESALADWLRDLISLSELDLTTLRTISLHGFAFDTTTFEKLFSSCALTLRTIRIADCYCCGSYEAFSIFAANEVPQIVKLTGVEIYGLRFKDSILRRREHIRKRNDPTHRAMRSQEQICGSETAGTRLLKPRIWTACELEEKGRSEGVDLISGWPYERLELEDAMLAGRVNTIARRMGSASKKMCHKWWDEPVSYR
ncbi:hypothetical protein E2P81_ATG10214 [Venturia nashicola]|nr:hypothetical protein E2P81_ATG10214 [Venturia nashicola]